MVITTLSVIRFCRSAAITPRLTPMTEAMAMAKKPSRSETG